VHPDEILSQISDYGDAVRGRVFEFDPNDGRPIPSAFTYQDEIVQRIISAWDGGEPNRRGIVCLPTGAGKTRVAIMLMAAVLARNPEHRFIWAASQKGLLLQSMERLVELARLFPRPTRFRWLSAPGANNWNVSMFTQHITFVTRPGLQTLVDRLKSSRHGRSYRSWLFPSAGNSVTLIYDESHELGGQEIGRSLQRLVAEFEAQQADFGIVGLSATPIPTTVEATQRVQTLFIPPAGHAGPLDVKTYSFIRRGDLLTQRILCPVNEWFQENTGQDFDISELVSLETGWRPTGPTEKARLNELAKYYNVHVMSHPVVIEKLARSYVQHSADLGKTLIFVPTIAAANTWAQAIGRVAREMSQDLPVAVLHSRLGEFDEDVIEEPYRGEDRERETVLNPQAVVNAFRSHRDQPCALVNVNMATTGFDDPRIKTIILARLTFSRNLFWQMIGRGTRGPACGGTEFCNVIDPVRLTDGHGFTNLSDYKPSFQRGNYRCPDQTEPEDRDEMQVVQVDPRKASVRWAEFESGDEYRALRVELRELLHAFINGVRPFKAITQAPELAPVLVTAVSLRIAQARDSAYMSIGSRLEFIPEPTTVSESAVELFLRCIQVCVENRFLSKEDFETYQLARL